MDLLYKQKYIKYKKKYTELKQQIGGKWIKTDKTYHTTNRSSLTTGTEDFWFSISDSKKLIKDDKFVKWEVGGLFDSNDMSVYYALRTGDLWFINRHSMILSMEQDYDKIKNKKFLARAKEENLNFFEFTKDLSLHSKPNLAAPHSAVNGDDVEVYQLLPNTPIKVIGHWEEKFTFYGTITHNDIEHQIEAYRWNIIPAISSISRESSLGSSIGDPEPDVRYTSNVNPIFAFWGSGFRFVVQDVDTLLFSDKFEKIDKNEYGKFNESVGLYRVERTKKLWFIPNDTLFGLEEYKFKDEDSVKGVEIFKDIFINPMLACPTPDCTSPYKIERYTKIKKCNTCS